MIVDFHRAAAETPCVPRALSQLRDTVLVACLAALSCLPPSGWQLCVGADGHWAIEPSSVAGDACCDDSPSADASGADAADDCTDCTDYALAGTIALGSRPVEDGPEITVDAPCVTIAGTAAQPLAALARPPGGATRTPPHSALEFRNTILRI